MEAVDILRGDVEEFVRCRREARHSGQQLGDDTLREMISQVFPDVSAGRQGEEKAGSSGRQQEWRRWQLPSGSSVMFWLLVVASVAITAVLIDNRGQRVVLGYCQDLVYPIMRLVRLSTLPLTRALGLARFHEEECIVGNPLYREACAQSECWSCADVRTVLDMSGPHRLHNFTDYYYNGGAPFIVRNALYRPVTYESLQRLHTQYGHMLDDGTAYFLVNHANSAGTSITTMEEFFRSKSVLEQRDLHAAWMPRRVAANRVLRTVVPRPSFVPPSSEVSLEKFVFVDGHESPPYELPLTEFANVFVIQGSGYRTIALAPVHCCRAQCKSVMVRLNPRELLYYNWQFWRPVSLPTNPEDEIRKIMKMNANPPDSVSVTIIGSFY